MTIPEVEECLQTIVCICDTREQPTQKLKIRLTQIGYPIERLALNAGDYSGKIQLPDYSWFQIPVAIERKESLNELCSCFCQERKRFTKEFERAREAHIKLYLLIENGTWENIYSGKYRSRMASKSLVASILAWLSRYDCQLIMCKSESSGKIIRDIIYYEARENLMRMVDE